MKKSSVLPLIVSGLICSIMLGLSPASVAATATNLVTICLSATTTTQASKCTKWQYNVYSPTAYIETYPQVSPGPKVWTDPAYQYILGSSITPTMGVKVCPTALTPGVSFNNASADPCPNNVLVAASTVLPANSYAVTTDTNGIVVYQVNTSGASVAPGSPFGGPSQPRFTAVDPTGQYLYALYDSGSATIASFKMMNGAPQQLVGVVGFTSNCANCDPDPSTMIATATHVYADDRFPGALILVFSAANGALTKGFTVGFSYANNLTPTTFAVDPQEQFIYWYASSDGGDVPDTVEIFSLNFSTSSGTLIKTMPIQGMFTLGAK